MITETTVTIILGVIAFTFIIIPYIIININPLNGFSNKKNDKQIEKVVLKSNFRIELENECSKYHDFTFEKSKNKFKCIGIESINNIKFIDNKNLAILHLYKNEYIDIEFNSKEDYEFEKNRMKDQYKNYKKALSEHCKFYPPKQEDVDYIDYLDEYI